MKLLVDMNLSSTWVDVLRRNGWDALHWSEVGAANAPDQIILKWAREHGYVIITHDLDFGAILAATRASIPSVIQFRTQNIFPEFLEDLAIKALQQYQSLLEQGALIVVDTHKARARILPL